jgi:DNA modification methylase
MKEVWMETNKTEGSRGASNSGDERPCASAGPGSEPRPPDSNGVAQQEVGPRQQAERIEAELRQALRPQVIEQVALEKLKPRGRNARLHSNRQVEQLAASIREFGFVGAIIIDEAGNVLAGHGRLAAAKLVGLHEVPCVRVDHLDEPSKAAFALADNRLAELSGWDDDILKLELRDLESIADFDVEVTGFDTVDLDRLLGPEPDPHADPDDNIPELHDDKPAVSKRGDLWMLGEHRLLCGDVLELDDYRRLLGDEQVVQVVSDPPYNVPIRGNVSSKGFREFAMASGELSEKQFAEFLAKWLINASKVSRDGAILHSFMDWRHMPEMLAAIGTAGLRFMNLCVWVKPNAGMGTFYRSQHELVFVLKNGNAPHINNFGLGARGRNRSNVWRYPNVVHGARRGISDPEKGHPTPKPVAAIIDALKDCSRRGDVILDPFAGSGTAVIAAERIGRKARLIELDPHYVDLIVRRWQTVTGGNAILADDLRCFFEIEAERQASPVTDESHATKPAIAGGAHEKR